MQARNRDETHRYSERNEMAESVHVQSVSFFGCINGVSSFHRFPLCFSLPAVNCCQVIINAIPMILLRARTRTHAHMVGRATHRQHEIIWCIFLQIFSLLRLLVYGCYVKVGGLFDRISYSFICTGHCT